MEGTYKEGCLDICRGDRVALINSTLQEYGWVKWVGRKNPNDHNSELLAGVELDKATGTDNHKLNGHYLFETLPGHGLLLPASCLMRVEDLIDEAQESAKVYRKRRNNNKNIDNPLGGDLSHLSAFHQLAFEQLKNSSENSQNCKLPPCLKDNQLSSKYEREHLDLLPHMKYEPMPSDKDDDHIKYYNKYVRPRSKSSCRVSSQFDEKRCQSGNILSPDGSSARFGQSKCDMSTISASSGANLRDYRDLSPCVPTKSNTDSFEAFSPSNPFGYLSRNGVDQLEILGFGERDIGGGSIEGHSSEEFVVGSMIEIDRSVSHYFQTSKKPIYGVIRWIGVVADDMEKGLIAGVEMDEFEDGLSDGTLKGERYFVCPIGKGIFVSLGFCSKDRRFLENQGAHSRASLAFGSLDCQPVCGSVAPISNIADIQDKLGRNRGIQGHQNSCYLDATLFSMFAFTSVFDSLLFRPPTLYDIEEYVEVQTVLREEIVNPLRKNMYVRADRVMKLRTMLDNLSSVSGLTTEEKDPEEFLHSLLAQILKADPLLKLSSGQDTYHYQLFVDKDDRLNLPSVQTLFDQSILTSDIKLKQVPSCLIIQMPRFGKDYKMYPRILPSMVLDVTDVIEDSPRQCFICGKLAEFECKECFGHCGSGLESIAFCPKCIEKVHSHKKRGAHKLTRRLTIPPEFQMLADHCVTIPRVYMELFAVVCIETSHYVSFSRCGTGGNATWCFFDSMADRKGEQNGYNIPKVTECGDLMQWIGDEGSQTLSNVTDNKSLPDLPRRLLCDAYMCFYQSPKVVMYS